MNKAIYFTNATSQEYFTEYLKGWSISPNLSNQNFHNKLIRAIATKNKVEVISVRPINKFYKDKSLSQLESNELNISWKYPKVSRSKLGKYLCLSSRINKVLSLDKDETVIFVDCLNLSLLKEAIKLAKKSNYKVIGVCTDNPYNISYTSKMYTEKVMKLARSLDGYITLTPAITKLFNVNNKPSIQIDGVSEDVTLPNKKVEFDKYIYFGGSLMKEYGVYELIDAFNELDLKDTKLVLCGHHYQKEIFFKKIESNPNIVYLGPISYIDNLALEKNSLVTVNPRPINPQIDDYSMPSKTLECLSIGALNITVENKLLKEHYSECIIWSKSSSKKDLKSAITKALSLDKKEKDRIITLGKEKVMERTSLEVIGNSIHDFI